MKMDKIYKSVHFNPHHIMTNEMVKKNILMEEFYAQ